MLSATEMRRGPAAVVLGLGLVAVFTLPYLFGHPDGHSQSYMAHFSNRVALVLLAGCAAVLGWGTGVFGLRYPGQGARPDLERGSRWPMWTVAGLSVLLTAGVWALERRVGAAGEAMYFLDRYAQEGLGLGLYRGMEFSYGPLLFWPQVWVARGAGLGMGDAHFLVLLLEWPAGLALVWYVCRRLAGSRRDCVVLFALLSGIWGSAIVDGGVNYTPLRFLLAPALALWTWERWRAGRALAVTLGWALAGFWGLLFFSPEQGIAFAFGTVVFFGVLVRCRVGPLALFASGCGAGLAVAWRLGVLNTLLSIGGGSLDLPWLPSARMLVLLAGVVIAGALAVRAWGDDERTRPELYLTAVCAALLPAALGRADTGHVFINLLPLLAIAYCAMARTRGGFRWGTWALGGYLVVAGALHVGPFVKAMLWRVRHRAELAPAAGAETGRVLAPMGFPRAFAEGRPLPVVTGRYSLFLPLLNGGVTGAKVEELRRQAGVALVLPAEWQQRCTMSEKDRRLELKIALRPWFKPPARARDESSEALCRYIADRYVASARVAPAAGYVVMVPR